MSDQALSEIYEKSGSSGERLASLRNRISKVGKRALSPSSDVSEAELKRLRAQLKRLKEVSDEIETNEDLRMISEGALNKKDKLAKNLTNLEVKVQNFLLNKHFVFLRKIIFGQM